MVRVVVTGASGRLGSKVVRRLAVAGHEVVALDRRPADLPVPVEQLDLRDAERVAPLVAGAGAVVHLAAVVPSRDRAGPPAFEENVETTAAVVAAAASAHVPKFVFASSIQVVASESPGRAGPAAVAHLPLDGASPPNPTTGYAWGKYAGELLVRAAFRNGGHEAVALRFPWLVTPEESRPWGRPLQPFGLREAPTVVAQGFSCLSLPDAARVIEAVLRTSLPGFRTYLPALSVVPVDRIPAYVRRYYSAVPLRTPLDRLASLIDLSAIREETGWSPRDVPPDPFAAARPLTGWDALRARLGFPWS